MKKAILCACFSLAFVSGIRSQNVSPYWSLAGNSNATTASSKLGTTNAVSLRLFTNNLERLRITDGGNLGINITTSPSRLAVNAVTGASPFRAYINGGTKFWIHANGGTAIGSATTPPANGLYSAGNVGIGVVATA